MGSPRSSVYWLWDGKWIPWREWLKRSWAERAQRQLEERQFNREWAL